MNLPLVDRAVRVGSLAQIAQLEGTQGAKTDQTAQTDQGIEIAGQLGTSLAPEPTTRHPKLTSGTAQQPDLSVQVVGTPIDSVHPRPRSGAPPS